MLNFKRLQALFSSIFTDKDILLYFINVINIKETEDNNLLFSQL